MSRAIRMSSSLVMGLSCVAFALHTQQALAQQQPAQPPAQPAQQQPQQQQGQPQRPGQAQQPQGQPQQQQQQQQQQQGQPQPEGQNVISNEPLPDEGKPTSVEGSNIVVEPQMQPGDRPEAPGKLELDEEGDRETRVLTGAGVGSEVAYASEGVVELGGSLALTHMSETTTLRIAPSVGYFLIDNVELTLFPELIILNVEDETDVTFGGVLEPSYHLPFNDRIYGFVGMGLGLRYAEDPGVDVFLRPRLGLDFMVGRSGILKPAFFLDIGANDGLTSGGAEVGFTVML